MYVCMYVCTHVCVVYDRTENWVATGGAQSNEVKNSNDIKELPLMVPEHTTHCMTDKKTESPQAVPIEMMRWYKMTRVATGGARTRENWVATGGAQRNDAMKSNEIKGSSLAVPDLNKYVHTYDPMTEQKTESPQAGPKEKWCDEFKWNVCVKGLSTEHLIAKHTHTYVCTYTLTYYKS